MSWKYIETLPESREGPIYKHDYSDTLDLEGYLVPKFIDLTGRGQRPPTEGVLRLVTAEVLLAEPPGLFTRDGALARAAEAAKPMVQAFRRSFYWHDSPEAAGMEQSPIRDSTPTAQAQSWSTAFITGGVVVLALGGLAWWRSRR